jgi:hypothetical protein
MASIFNKSVLTGGGFQDASGLPVSFGYLEFTLYSDSNISVLGGPTGQQVVAGRSVKIFLDTNGNAQPNQSIWANSVLNPPGSFYLVKLFNSSGLEVWGALQSFTLNYQPIINLGTLSPSSLTPL